MPKKQSVEIKVKNAAKPKRGRRKQPQVVTDIKLLAPQPSGRARARRNRRPGRRTTKFSEAGEAWMRLYLSPMDADEPGLTGYPDGESSDAVLCDYAKPYNVAFPSASDVTGTVGLSEEQLNNVFTSDNVSVLFLMLPVAEKHVLLRIYPGPPPTNIVPVAIDTTADLATMTFPNYYAFSSTGTLYNPASGTFGWLESVILVENLANHIPSSSSYRLIARAFTGIYTVPELERQGFVSCGQFQSELVRKPRTATFETDPVVTAVTGMPYTAPLGDIAPSELLEAYKHGFQGPCSEGFYLPIYFSGRENKFITPISDRIATFDSLSQTLGQDIFVDYPLGVWNVGVVWFESVSKNFSIKLKTRSVFEMKPLPGGTIQNFAKSPPGFDLAALDAAFTVRRTLRVGFPSSYNSWGWLGDIAGALAGLIPIVGPAAGPLVRKGVNWLTGN